MRATDREIDVDPEEPIILGIDVGRQGDQSVICVRQGAKVLEFRRKSEPDTTKTAQWILEAIADWEPEYTYIDVIGLGWGVFDMVKQRYRGIRGIDVSTASSRPEKFDRLRDEVYSRVRSVFETGLISIPLDDDLINELTCIKYEITTAGKTKIEGKKDMKRRGLASPNMADALALTFSQDQRISRLSDKKGSDKYRRKVAEERFTWMGA
jgi:hypothetical protein